VFILEHGVITDAFTDTDTDRETDRDTYRDMNNLCGLAEWKKKNFFGPV
jgi:hypothetical protein